MAEASLSGLNAAQTIFSVTWKFVFLTERDEVGTAVWSHVRVVVIVVVQDPLPQDPPDPETPPTPTLHCHVIAWCV